jgi:hypothetical protein
MSDPKFNTPRDPRQSQLTAAYASPQGICPDAPAGGGGPGRFTSRKPCGSSSVMAFHSQTGPKNAKDADWISRLNQSFTEIADFGEGVVDGIIETGKRAKNVVEAYFLARYKYIGSAILDETGRGLQELLEGLIPGLLMMLIVIAATTALGAAIGATIGALFGGVGAAPGAFIGAEAGLNFGIWILNWIGIGFLVIYVAKNLGQVLTLLTTGVERAWYAGTGPRPKNDDIHQAARELARAVAVLIRLILEGIVMYLLAKGAARVAEQLPGLVNSLKESKLGKGFAEWVERNHKSLLEDPRINPQLREKATSSGSQSGATPNEAAPSQPAKKAANPEPKKEKPVRTVAQDREAISKLSNEAEALRKQGKIAESNAKIAEARNILEPHVKAKDWDAVVERLDVSTPKDKAYFWSGDKKGAQALAEKEGAMVLESTPGGRVLDGWQRPEMEGNNGGKDLWPKVSRKYASGASGKVTAVQTPEKAKLGGGDVWRNDELPILQQRQATGKVSEIDVVVLPPK